MNLFLLLLQSIFQLQNEQSLDQQIDYWFGKATSWFVDLIFYQIPINDEVSLFWVLIPLIFGALFFTIYFKFPNIRLLGLSAKIVSGKYDSVDTDSTQANIVDGDNPDTIRKEHASGEVSHFQALSTALSATVGLGNIAGVAIAVVVGGAGATFWMIIAGFLGMSSKFVECTLGVKYRDVDKDGKVYGGPMYYISKGIPNKFGKVLAFFFAMMCILASFGGGNMFQSNQATSIFLSSVGLEEGIYKIIFGVILAFFVAVVIIGGIKRIAKVTEKVVPFMAIIYVGAALIILVLNYQLIPLAIETIVTRAFSPIAVAGGTLGVLVQGFRRAAFSNEAGIGSSPIAHATVKTNYPASEGLVALLEPFIDTVVICTFTALVIVIGHLEGYYHFGGTDGSVLITGTDLKLSGVGLTSYVFEHNIPYFSIVLTVAVLLFAFSTMISWSYYGLQSWVYVFGKGAKKELVYKILFCVFIVVGATVKMGNVLDFSDAMIFAMMVPNMVGLFILYPKVSGELNRYLKAIGKK
ncbi:MAG TPA: alanine/glycine:cation symporter family protein [Chitinophagales bacterium]|nr:alanine/glycine:cation symporter family protein [Chitinophagales bacterium]